MVDRYDLEVYSQGASGQCEDGAYVLYEDYLALAAKLSDVENDEIDARCHIADLKEELRILKKTR